MPRDAGHGRRTDRSRPGEADAPEDRPGGLGDGRALGRPGPGRAAVFRPLRRAIQRAVDRRFNRRAYDAAATIEAFAVRLRQQVDPDALRDELLALVDQTVQPTRASLWLRPTRQDIRS